MEGIEEKRKRLREILRAHAPLLVAYSGGVDSAYLLAEAKVALGDLGLLGVIADSASLPRKALEGALKVAEEIGAKVEVVQTGELMNPDYNSNPLNRCYFCKAELFGVLERIAGERRFQAIAYGENADDMRQVRPGRKAAEEYAVLAPLRDVGLSKAEIRWLSEQMGLPTADAPAQPCLSSRIPHGTPVTADALGMVEAGEEWVRSLGFRVFRVRHLVGEDGRVVARLQVAPVEIDRISLVESQLEQGLIAVGYSRMEVDPAGYRSAP